MSRKEVVKRNIKVDYTSDEIMVFKANIGVTEFEIMELEDEASQIKAPIKDMKEAKKDLYTKIKLGFRFEDVDVIEFKNFEDNIIEYTDPITGELLGKRDMVSGDHQLRMEVA